MVAEIKENELVRTASICVPCRDESYETKKLQSRVVTRIDQLHEGNLLMLIFLLLFLSGNQPYQITWKISM